MSRAVAHAVNHEIRRLLIEALWHHRDALTVERFYGEWIEDSRVSFSQIGYHVRQLVTDGIVKLDGERETTSPSVPLSSQVSTAARQSDS